MLQIIRKIKYQGCFCLIFRLFSRFELRNQLLQVAVREGIGGVAEVADKFFVFTIITYLPEFFCSD
jgi:hypothetical protein